MIIAQVDLELDRFTYGGECMGRLPDGRAVFVPFSLPGERARCVIKEERKGFARAEMVEILRPSPERIPPRCAHYTLCGGCHYQHLAYPAQLRAKEAILRDQLERIAGIPSAPVRSTVSSPNTWNYRNHIQFHLDLAGKPGYLAAGSSEVVAIRECHLPEPGLNELWPLLEFEPGTLERVALRLGMDGEALLALEGDQAPELSIEDLPVSVVLIGETGDTVLAGDDALLMEIKGRPFRVSAGSFFQVNTPLAGELVDCVMRLLDPTPNDRVLDLYCGVGLFSVFLAQTSREVIGVELSPAACSDFVVNLDEYDNVYLYEGAVEDVLPALPIRPNLAVVDPPRAGLERVALDALLQLAPERIIYVSCDPATLARDAKRLLVGGYTLVETTPFDLFPQTYHIESVTLFGRK
jgi:23S rRNA (uracil1939-C5)-methyltransferase